MSKEQLNSVFPSWPYRLHIQKRKQNRLFSHTRSICHHCETCLYGTISIFLSACHSWLFERRSVLYFYWNDTTKRIKNFVITKLISWTAIYAPWKCIHSFKQLEQGKRRVNLRYSELTFHHQWCFIIVNGACL